jgi:hypothetical protein
MKKFQVKFVDINPLKLKLIQSSSYLILHLPFKLFSIDWDKGMLTNSEQQNEEDRKAQKIQRCQLK